MAFCAKCGSPLKEGGRFCVKCGAAAPGAAPAEKSAGSAKNGAKPPEKKLGKGKLAAIIAAAAAVVLIAAAIIILPRVLRGANAKKREYTVKQFEFIDCAFECGQEPESTKLIAVIDPAADTSGLKLYAVCDDTGEKIKLRDDGKGPDSFAGDNVFYGEEEFSSDEEMTLVYTLRADPGGRKLSAPEAMVKFYTLESVYEEEAAIEEMMDELDEIAEDYDLDAELDEDEYAENYNRAVEEMENYLKRREERGEIESYEWNAPCFTVESNLETFCYRLGGFEGMLAGGSSGGEETGRDFTMGTGNKAALLLSQHDYEEVKDGDTNWFEWCYNNHIQAMRTLVDAELGYKVTVKTGNAVDKETLKSLQEYSFIDICTHGSCSETYGSLLILEISCYDSFSVGDRIKKRVLIGNDYHAVLTYKFFEKYYDDGELNNCLVYLQGCNCAEDPLLADTLIRKGANAVIAYSGLNWTDYDAYMVNSLMSDLVRLDDEYYYATHTVEDAVKRAKYENGEQWYTNNIYTDNKTVMEEMKLFQPDTGSKFRLIQPDAIGEFGGAVIDGAGTVAWEVDRIRVEKGVDDYLNGFLSDAYFRYTKRQKEYIFYPYGGESPAEAVLYVLNPLYDKLHKEDPARFPHNGIWDLNIEEDYELSPKDRARAEDAGLDELLEYYARYDLEDIEAVLDRLYGKGRVSPEDYFGENCFATSDGYLLLPAFATDYFYNPVCRYKLYDLEKAGDSSYRVTLSCVTLSCDYKDTEYGIYEPDYGTYVIRDMMTIKELSSGSDPSLNGWDDYERFAVQAADFDAATRFEIVLYEDANGFHLDPDSLAVIIS